MTTENFNPTQANSCQAKPEKNKNKENSAKKQVRRQPYRRASGIGSPSNENISAYVLESEGLSVVPYFKKTPMPRDSPRLKWSFHEVTNQPTITRKENYANGRWCETPPKTVLPKPPPHWLNPRKVSKPLMPLSSSTLKSLPSSSISSISIDEIDDDILSLVSGIDDINSGSSRVVCPGSVHDSGFDQEVLSEVAFSELASFSIDSNVLESCEDSCSQISSLNLAPSDRSVSELEVLDCDQSQPCGGQLLLSILDQVVEENVTSYDIPKDEYCLKQVTPTENGVNTLCDLLASFSSE